MGIITVFKFEADEIKTDKSENLLIKSVTPFAQASALIGKRLTPLAHAITRSGIQADFVTAEKVGCPGTIRQHLIPKGQNIKPVSTTL